MPCQLVSCDFPWHNVGTTALKMITFGTHHLNLNAINTVNFDKTRWTYNSIKASHSTRSQCLGLLLLTFWSTSCALRTVISLNSRMQSCCLFQGRLDGHRVILHWDRACGEGVARYQVKQISALCPAASPYRSPLIYGREGPPYVANPGSRFTGKMAAL